MLKFNYETQMKKLSLSFLSHNFITLFTWIRGGGSRKRISASEGWGCLASEAKIVGFATFRQILIWFKLGNSISTRPSTLFLSKVFRLTFLERFNSIPGKLCFRIDLIHLITQIICRHTALRMKTSQIQIFCSKILIKKFSSLQSHSANECALSVIAKFMTCFTFLTFNLHQRTVPLLFLRSPQRFSIITEITNSDLT